MGWPPWANMSCRTASSEWWDHSTAHRTGPPQPKKHTFWELSGAALREHLKDHEGPNEILYRMAHSNYQEERDLVRPVVRFFEALRYEMLHHAPEKAPLRDLWNPEDNLGMTAIDYVCSGPADTHVAKKRRTAHTQQAPPAAAAAGQGAQLDIAINKEESDIDMRGGLTDGEEET
mmetsp:Transcript_51037/g.128044  ORF Transcript_51037/g.128044 Transcript_51037/m.128044 type:complete len:175 (-) Transcript_51037:1298-1822(-)